MQGHRPLLWCVVNLLKGALNKPIKDSPALLGPGCIVRTTLKTHTPDAKQSPEQSLAFSQYIPDSYYNTDR